MFLHGSQNKENKKNKIIFVSIYIMPTKLYKIIGEDGEELHGIERKKELDKRLREKKKEEKKKKKKEIVEEDKTEEEKEEEESILEYPTIEQPHIDINSDHDDEIVVSEEEIQNYIREKEQKNVQTPSIPIPTQQPVGSIFNTILTGVISTSITTLVPIGLLIGMQKFSQRSATESNPQKPTNSLNGMQKKEFKQFTTFTPPN